MLLAVECEDEDLITGFPMLKIGMWVPTFQGFEIQHLNDYGTESLSALLYAVERLRSVVRAGDAEGFAALMERGKQYLTQRPTPGA